MRVKPPTRERCSGRACPERQPNGVRLRVLKGCSRHGCLYRDSELASIHLLTAMNCWTDPAGVVVAGSAWAGQLTTMLATDVEVLGGEKYVIFALNVAAAGALPLSCSHFPC